MITRHIHDDPERRYCNWQTVRQFKTMDRLVDQGGRLDLVEYGSNGDFAAHTLHYEGLSIQRLIDTFGHTAAFTVEYDTQLPNEELPVRTEISYVARPSDPVEHVDVLGVEISSKKSEIMLPYMTQWHFAEMDQQLRFVRSAFRKQRLQKALGMLSM